MDNVLDVTGLGPWTLHRTLVWPNSTSEEPEDEERMDRSRQRWRIVLEFLVSALVGVLLVVMALPLGRLEKE